MSGDMDPVDGALQSLAGQQWPGNPENPELERRIMQALDTQKHVSRSRVRRLVLPAAIVLLGSTVLVAAGGWSLIRSWFITVEVNGNVVHSGEMVLDPNGQAVIAVPAGALQPGSENEIAIQLQGAGGGPEEQTIVITTDDGEHELKVHVNAAPDPNEGS